MVLTILTVPHVIAVIIFTTMNVLYNVPIILMKIMEFAELVMRIAKPVLLKNQIIAILVNKINYFTKMNVSINVLKNSMLIKIHNLAKLVTKIAKIVLVQIMMNVLIVIIQIIY